MTFEEPLSLVHLQVFNDGELIDESIRLDGEFGANQNHKSAKIRMVITHTPISFDDAIKIALERDIEIKRHDLARKVVLVLRECKIDYLGYLEERAIIIEAAKQL